MRQVVGYARVSTDGQTGDDKFGLDSQKSTIMEYCARNDMQIREWYIDEGESGVKLNRPRLDDLLYGDIANPPIEAVVVAKNDRIARDMQLYFYYKQLLYMRGIKLISVSEDFGMMGAFSNMLESFVMFVAEQERMNISKRTSAGRKIKAAQGGYSGGRAPFGYRAENKRLVVVESEADIVRSVFAMRDAGATYKEICDALNAEGLTNRSGTKFSISTLQVILGNRKLYEGMYKYGDAQDWVSGIHDAIL